MGISLKHIVGEMSLQDQTMYVYMNRITGETVYMTDTAIEAAEAGAEDDPESGMPLDEVRAALSSDEYVQLPSKYEIHDYQIMQRFAGSVADQSTADMLYRALDGSGAFRKFRDKIHRHGLEQDWYGFQERAYEQIAIDWCEEHGIEYER